MKVVNTVGKIPYSEGGFLGLCNFTITLPQDLLVPGTGKLGFLGSGTLFQGHLFSSLKISYYGIK